MEREAPWSEKKAESTNPLALAGWVESLAGVDRGCLAVKTRKEEALITWMRLFSERCPEEGGRSIQRRAEKIWLVC